MAYRLKNDEKFAKVFHSYEKDKIDEQILNRSGVLDTARILKINKNLMLLIMRFIEMASA